MTLDQPARPRRRPRDRKHQIVVAARDLFHQRGFGNVGTGEIAAAVGITSGALYRHFPSKQDILLGAVDDVVNDDLVAAPSGAATLPELITAVSDALRQRRSLGVLWHRELRHVDAADRDRVSRLLQHFLDDVATTLLRVRPELDESAARTLTWFVISTLTSPSYHSAVLPGDREIVLLEHCALVVATTPMSGDDQPSVQLDAGPEALPAGLAHLSRRERIVAVATRLFFERGYQATTMEEVGAATGVTGAAVYKHFESKAALLGATIARADGPLQLGLTRSLMAANTADEALTLVLDEYIRFAIQHHHLVGILVAEVASLPEEQRTRVRRQQADYVAEWVRLLRESRPDLDRPQARYLVQAVLSVVHDATRTDWLRDQRGLSDLLHRVGQRLIAVEL